MKKTASIIAVLIVALAFGACAKGTGNAYRVGLVTDTGGIDDKSFNQGTWEGIKLFAKENGYAEGKQVKYLQSKAEADYIPNLSAFADQGVDLVVAPGFLFNTAIQQTALKYPKVNFLIIDSVVSTPADKDSQGNDIAGTGGKPIPNVACAVFAENEGSFLAGVAAGLKAKADGKKIVGFVGGIQFALIEKFEAGYRLGLKAVYPECKILYDYAGAFDKPDIGQTLAQKQYNAGAYIIFQVAGATGNGVIKEAKERAAKGQSVWAIGVDKDQYADGIYSGDKSVVLTSMVKRVDTASHDIAALGKSGKFPGGQTMVFDLKNSGVGLPAKNPNLSDDIIAEVNKYADQIKSGTLTVPEVPVRN